MTVLLIFLRSLLPGLRSGWCYLALIATALLAWHFDSRAVANAAETRAQALRFKQAQIAAMMAAQQALQQQQAAYETKAQEAQSGFQTRLADSRSATARYVAAHSVHIATSPSDAGPTFARAKSGGADVSQDLPGNAVVVSANDMQACSDAVTYAIQAHDWAISLDP